MKEIEKLVRKNILKLKAYSSAREEFTAQDGIFMDANENPYGQLNRYPDPYQKILKKKLSELKNINIENIFIGNGSDEIIDLAMRVFCEPGKDKIINFTPSYGMYQVLADINNIKNIEIPLIENFQIDFEKTAKYFSDENIKMIIICSPNNPTGNLINPETIKKILKKFKGILLIDEAYIDFSNSESWIKQLDNYPNLIVTQTLSKAWALAAARIGMAYASKSIVKLLNKIKPPYNISSPNQIAAIKVLQNKKTYDNNINIILNEKEKLIQELSNIKIVKKIFPSDTNFLLIEVENAPKIYNELIQKKIIIRNRNNLIKNTLRISIGTPQENKQLIKALKNIK